MENQFLGRAVIALVIAAMHGMTVPPAIGEDSSVTLGRRERVRVKMEARGELFAPIDNEGGEVRRPFNASARFDFLEWLAGDTAADAEPSSPPDDAVGVSGVGVSAVGIRHFFSAASELSIDRGGETRRSLGEASSTLVVSSSPAVAHFAVENLLTREETELLAIAFDPVLLDRLLPPADAAATGWHPPAELTAALLAIDTVGRIPDDPAGEEGGPLLVRVEPPADPDAAAKLLVTGTVHGAVDGVSTTIRIDGSYDLDGSGRRVKGGLVRLTEKRLAGHVSPGFECEATFQMARRPAEGSLAAPAPDEAVLEKMRTAWTRLLTGESIGTPRKLKLQESDRRFTLVHDARWRAVADDARGLVMRLVDDGALLAECTVSTLPPGEAGMPLDEFRRDIERSLRGRLGRFNASDEKPVAEHGGRVLRVVSEGSIDGMPLEWRHFLIEDGRGSRTAVTFTVERRFADRFGRADEDFIAGLTPKKGTAP